MRSIFVSSTFRDMNFERDVLNRSISPKLNHQLSSYGQSLRIMDLRWGVDTTELSEQEASERVLRVCFDAIENCRPCILILLGDRYGFVPEGSEVSVTHMEIIRGALENAQRDNVYIYCRETDYSGIPEQQRQVFIEQDPVAAQKLVQLKERLLQQMPERCRTYHARWSDTEQQLVSEDFEGMVLADLKAGFVDSLSAVCYRSELHRQLHENQEILDEHVRYAYRDESMMRAQLQTVMASSSPCGIIGQAGAGKSVYLSLLCAALRDEQKQAQILFCGDNAYSASVRNAAEYTLHLLTNAAGQAYDFEAGSQLSYEALLEKLIALRAQVPEKTYLLLDAVDKCDDGMVSFILWCHRYLSEQLVIVFSSRMLEEITQNEKSFTLTQMQYDRASLLAMTQRLLHKYGKNLNDTLLQQVSQKATTPLQLQLLLLRLLNLGSEDFDAIQRSGGGMDAINTYLGSLIENSPEDIEELIADQLQLLLDQSDNPSFCIHLLGLLSFSEYGLQEVDLQQVSELMSQSWVQLDYVEFLSRFGFFIRTRDNGRLDISHDIMRQTLRKLLHPYRKMICSMLSLYFLHREDQDVFSVRSFFQAARLGGQTRRVTDFFVKYGGSFSSLDPQTSILAREIRKCVLQLFLEDKGAFLLAASHTCKTLQEFMQFQMALSSSLLYSNDYQSEEMILRLVAAVMSIPAGLKEFPTALAEIELRSCENYAYNRHKTKTEEIERFLQQCREIIRQRKVEEQPAESHRQETQDPVERMLALLRDRDADPAEQMGALEDLSQLGRQLAREKETAAQAEPLLQELLQIMDEGIFDLDPEIQQIMLADVYTSLGEAHKSMEHWEEAIRYDGLSRDIYQALYEQNQGADMFRKYRERVYNLANVVEAWAIRERTNADLWQQTCRLYAQVYQMDMRAIAQGIPERELLQCASSILSYGTALLNVGERDAGVEKYREGIRLLTELTDNNPRLELYLECCLHLAECIFQLVAGAHYEEAAQLSDALCASLTAAMSSDSDCRDIIMTYIRSLSNQINDRLAEMFKTGNLDGAITISRMLCQVYITVLPIAELTIRANIILTQRNIADIFFLKMEDYAQAQEEYCKLLDWVEKYDLMAPDESGEFADEVNMRLADVYWRAMFCLEQLGRKDEVKRLLDGITGWAKNLANHAKQLRGDGAWVLYVMGGQLAKRKSPLGMMLWMMAFGVTQEEDYDTEKNSETVLQIINTLFGPMGSDSAE